MMSPMTPRCIAGVVCAAVIGACGEPATGPARERVVAVASAPAFPAVGSAPKQLDVARCAPGAGGFTIAFTNPYFPAPVGRQWVYEGEEDGESLRLEITVLDQTRLVSGVTTRVIEEREWIDDELVEVSWNYYAQAADGTVCYFGEDVDIYEDPETIHEGRWCASTAGNAPGIFMPIDPHPGMKFPMEIAPGIAEDEATVLGIGPVEVPVGRFTETIRFREYNPLDGDKGYKVFAARTGLVVDGPAELIAVNQTAGVPAAPVLTEQVCGT